MSSRGARLATLSDCLTGSSRRVQQNCATGGHAAWFPEVMQDAAEKFIANDWFERKSWDGAQPYYVMGADAYSNGPETNWSYTDCSGMPGPVRAQQPPRADGADPAMRILPSRDDAVTKHR